MSKSGDTMILQDILGMIGETVPRQIVRAWTAEEYTEVQLWASSVLLKASDNAGIHIPKVPAVIEAHRAGKRPHLELKPVMKGKLRTKPRGKKK